MKRLTTLICVLGLVFTSGCSDDESPDGTPALFVRARNLADVELNALVLSFRDGRQESFGTLGLAEETRFREVAEAHPLVGVTLTAEDELYTFSPDYSALDPLDIGNYTYELALDEVNNTVIVTLVEEE